MSIIQMTTLSRQAKGSLFVQHKFILKAITYIRIRGWQMWSNQEICFQCHMHRWKELDSNLVRVEVLSHIFRKTVSYFNCMKLKHSLTMFSPGPRTSSRQVQSWDGSYGTSMYLIVFCWLHKFVHFMSISLLNIIISWLYKIKINCPIRFRIVCPFIFITSTLSQLFQDSFVLVMHLQCHSFLP